MRFALALLLLLCYGTATAEQNELAGYGGDLTFSFHGLPVFAEFPAENAPRQRAAKIVFGKDKLAWRYRTTLRRALAAEPDFNGHYVFAIAGCGTGCQLNWIVDVETGNLVWQGQTEMGIAYRRDSSLFIPNLFESDLDLTDGPYFQEAKIVFRQVKGGKAITVAEVSGRQSRKQ